MNTGSLPNPVTTERPEGKIAYKVVRPLEGELLSAIMEYRFALRYRIGEWTEPHLPGTPLMAFVSWEKAQRMITHYWPPRWRYTYQIWRVETEELPWQHNYLSQRGLWSPESFDTDKVIDFWKDGRPYFDHSTPLPIGTVLCRRLKLMERLT